VLRIQARTTLLAIVVVALGACAQGGDEAGQVAAGGGGGGGGTVVTPVTEFDLANGCFTLLADGQPVKRSGTAFTTAAGDAASFLMRATNLGRYAFFTQDAQFMTGEVGTAEAPATGTAVTATAEPSDGSDWTFTRVAAGTYNAQVGGRALGVGSAGELAMAATPATLTFERLAAAQCATFPEMPTLIGETYTLPPGGELIGFADVHAHMAMGSDMSDGSGDRGPSAGGAMYGHAANRFGVREALKDCSTLHGPGGNRSGELVLDSEPDPHDTVGWPTFVDWPARDSLLHQQMYYKLVERSYKAGLRLMVLHGTSIEALCDVAKKANPDNNVTTDCSDMGVGLKQVAYGHDIQDYVDAQNGGPGKGWFRIAKDPAEAEAIIRAGKMAVVPGLEFSNIFKCNVTYQGSPRGEVDGDPAAEVVGCTTQMIDEQIEIAWNAGVRGIFLYHDVDSALGGAGIFSAALNAVNYYGTKGWWQTYTCADQWTRPEDQGYFYGPGAVMLGADGYGALLDNPLGAALIGGAGGTYPIYPSTDQCNARGTTPLGRYALEAAMKKGFVLDIDHAEISIKQDMLDEAARTTPAYPMISAHGGHGGFTNAQVLQMLRQGGIMYPGMVNGREYKNFYNKVEAVWNQMTPAEKIRYPIAVGYGADQNGLANQPGPRGGDDVVPVDYDNIRLFRGAGWSGRFSGLPAVPVSLLTVPESGKYWNVDEVGVAHYGLIPDVVEQIRIEADGDTKYLDGFYNSAAAYIRLWKQTVEASAARPAPVRPDPSTLPEYVPHPIDPSTGSPPSVP
jgi:hypothetical protein